MSKKVGIYKIENSAYHQGEGLSSTDIKELIKSPLHYKTYCESEKEETKEMLLGSLVHCLVLEPENFDNEFAVGEFNVRRGKEYEKICEENPDKRIVSRAELDEALAIKESILNEKQKNPILARLLKGHKEMAFYWKDPKTGLLCKCKPDILGEGFIADLKILRDVTFDGVQKAIVDYGYFISAPHYLNGVKETLAQTNPEIPIVTEIPTHFALIAVENKPPYAVATYYLSEDAVHFGERLIEKALARLKKASETQEWTAFPRKMIEINLPNYAMYKFNYLGDNDE